METTHYKNDILESLLILPNVFLSFANQWLVGRYDSVALSNFLANTHEFVNQRSYPVKLVSSCLKFWHHARFGDWMIYGTRSFIE